MVRWVWIAALLLVTATGHAAPPPDTAAGWAERLATHYNHASSVKIEPTDKVLANALCGRARLFELEPGMQLALAFKDPNLFQRSLIRIARVKSGTDVIAAVRKAGKQCRADKRYQVALQAGDMLFVYGAACSQMATPWYYDVADLIGAIEAEGGVLESLAIANACGSFDHDFVKLEELRERAKKQRKLYKHRFPASREQFKQSRASAARSRP